MKYEFVVTCEVEKDHYRTKKGQEQLCDQIAGRLWTVDGVSHGTATCEVLGADKIVVTRAEIEQLKAKITHLECLLRDRSSQ